MSFIEHMAELLNKKQGLALLILTLVLGYNIYAISETKAEFISGSEILSTDYAYNVLELGLVDASTSDQIIIQVEELTGKGEDGKVRVAQLGSIRTLCDNAPYRLLKLMDVNTSLAVCRIAYA